MTSVCNKVLLPAKIFYNFSNFLERKILSKYLEQIRLQHLAFLRRKVLGNFIERITTILSSRRIRRSFDSSFPDDKNDNNVCLILSVWPTQKNIDTVKARIEILRWSTKCDQMVKLFFDIWPLANMKISQIMFQICPSMSPFCQIRNQMLNNCQKTCKVEISPNLVTLNVLNTAFFL